MRFRYAILLAILLAAAASPCRAWDSQVFEQFKKDGAASILYNFSYAGYRGGEAPIPDVPVAANARDFGAIPNDGKDDANAINQAIEAAAKKGGGAVLLAAGRYDINVRPDAFSHIVIAHPGIVLRGAGSGADGTVLHLHNKMLNEKEYGTFVIEATGPASGSKDARHITAPAPKGSHVLTLDRTEGLKPGDIVRVLQFNPNENGKRTDRLSAYLVRPLKREPEWRYFARWAPFVWHARVAETLDANRIRLVQPLPMDISLEWGPQIRPAPMMSGVGVESLRLTSAWQGGYRHHKNREVDYAWSAIKFTNIANGWVRDVKIANFTQDVNLTHCLECAVTRVGVSGHAGHHGMTTTGWHNLFDTIRYDTTRTHTAGANSTAIGNVFRNFTVATSGGYLDNHGGGFPMRNLYENINNVRIAGAGATQNMPHAGPRNVFWNIVAGKPGRAPDDFFASGYWNYYAFYKKRGFYRTDLYKLYPRSIVVGCHAPKDKLLIEGTAQDRSNEWITVEGLGKPGVQPASLYEAQTNLRMTRW